jgi:hypothetical protein
VKVLLDPGRNSRGAAETRSKQGIGRSFLVSAALLLRVSTFLPGPRPAPGRRRAGTPAPQDYETPVPLRENFPPLTGGLEGGVYLVPRLLPGNAYPPGSGPDASLDPGLRRGDGGQGRPPHKITGRPSH